MTDTPAALDRRHGIPGLARVVEGRGGLTKVEVTTAAATGEMYLHGGQVTSWAPAGHADVLFVSAASRWEPGRAIRGGIPVCFPWFGNKPGDAQAPAHGFVRSRTWALESIVQGEGGITVTVSTASDDRTRAHWPFDFRLTLRATFGPRLQLELEAANPGATPLTIEEALHTYYAIGDVATVRVAGLDGVRYLDKVGAGRDDVQAGDIAITAETDRIYVSTAGAVDIVDPTLRRRLRVSKRHSESTVVWNPWIEKARALPDLQDDDWTRMVCVETCNVQSSAVVLPPGGRQVMTLAVDVEKT
jgi:glucose-6-phosphate 1-epimerase